MKIAFLTPEYPHTITGKSGGLGTSIRSLALGLIDQGCAVRVLVYGQNEETTFEEEGIVIQRIKNIKVKGLSWFLTRKKIEKIINHLYNDGSIEVVEAADWTGITSFIKPKKCPIVIRLHGSDTYFCHLDNRPVKWSNKFHEKRALQNANGHLSVSNYTAEVTNQLFHQENKFTIIHNGADSNGFNTGAIENNNQKILYFGTLIRKKGLLELPYIFNLVVEKNPNAELILVGKDASDIMTGSHSTWEMMQKLFSSQAKKKVHYLGPVPYSEIKKYIDESTLCVFPSFAEAFPVSWLEAMAMSKAIVASNIGWGKEVITDGEDGFLVHPNNHKEFATKISLILESKELKNKLGKKAREKVISDFDIQKIAAKNIVYYKKLISKK